MAGIDGSLKRLGTDYVDLYQIHRWDYETPIEETLEALHDIVKAGKARYIGASSMHAWQFAKALYTADLHGWTRFVSMQPHYNMLYREEEREMLPLCRDQQIAVIPWSPLARGRLTRDWDASSSRQETDEVDKRLYAATAEADRLVIERVAEIAGRAASRAPSWRWPGSSPSRASRPRSSARASRSTSTTPWPRCRWRSPTRSSRSSRRLTCRMRWRGTRELAKNQELRTKN